jgi:regulatory protein
VKICCEPLGKDIFQVIINDEPWRKIHVSLFGKAPKLPENCLTLQEFEEKFHDLEYRQTKNYVLRRLAAQSQSAVEMAKKLKEKFVSQGNADRVIEEFKQLGYLNDHEWLSSFVKSNKAKNKSSQMISMKLRTKGFPQPDIENVLSEVVDPESDKTSILHLLNTKYRQRNLSDFKEKQKVIAALVRRGFEFSGIKSVIDELLRK